MSLKLKLNNFFASYKLFTTSADLLNLMEFDEFKSDYSDEYPIISKVIDIDKVSENVIDFIYRNKGNYLSIGLLSKVLKTNVIIYGIDDQIMYNSNSGYNSTPGVVKLVTFDRLTYSNATQKSSSFIDLLKDLIWFITDETLVNANFVELVTVANFKSVNESNITRFKFIEVE